MSASKRITADILKSAEETLKTAEYGFEDLMKGTRERKLPALRSLIVFARATTNVLQNLRSTEPDFDEWYKKYKMEMESDPLIKYFYELRSKILKKGLLQTSTHAYVRHFDFPADMSRFGPPPPNVKGFFIGDNLGGSGWEIQLPNGSIEKYYVELPSDIGSVSLHFPEPPKFHLGQEIKDTSIETLSRMYLDYLCRLVRAATDRFKPN
ncbi:MAG TPA: hypothetical protein G4N93_01870 [Dehalococcoidia bacterium]|nr:hypothetical protein [Dehalococcoidia bacterium]